MVKNILNILNKLKGEVMARKKVVKKSSPKVSGSPAKDANIKRAGVKP